MPTEPTPPSEGRVRPAAVGRRRALGLVTVDGPPPSLDQLSPRRSRETPPDVGAVGNTQSTTDAAEDPPIAPPGSVEDRLDAVLGPRPDRETVAVPLAGEATDDERRDDECRDDECRDDECRDDECRDDEPRDEAPLARSRDHAGGDRRARAASPPAEDSPAPGASAPAGTRRLQTAPPAAPAMWRRVGFALLLGVLVVAVPVLGLVGYRTLSNSTDGRFAKTSSNPEAPGYVAQVEPTPTAVVIQYDKAHLPVGATFLSLSSPAGGGAVIFVPLNIGVLLPKLGAGPLKAAYLAFADKPEVARDQLAAKVGDVLNVGVGEVAELDDARWAQLVTPVAPLRFDNPEEVVLADGTVIPAGLTDLTADNVGPYLAVTKGAESETARFVRSQVVWKAWLDQVAKAGPGSVPGETTTGIGHFAQRLAAGTVSYDSVPVVASGGPLFNVAKDVTADLVTDAVPSPTPSHPGSRFTIRVLDGVSPGSIPPDLTRSLVRAGASVTVIGNAPSFGQTTTNVVYGDRADALTAKSVLRRIGGTGKARFDAEAPDTVDLTIVLGTDILGAAPATTTSPATTTTTQGP